MESERVWRPRMEIERVWRPRTESETVWRPSMEIEREWRLREQGKSAVCKNRITELHRTLDSPVNFGPGEEVPHLGSGAAHRRATSITGISKTSAVGGASIISGTWRTSGSTRRHGLWTQSGEIQRAVRKREITVPGGPRSQTFKIS